MNAKKEFLLTTDQYVVVGAVISFFDSDKFTLNPGYSTEEYDNFLKFLDREYDNGYGGELFGYIFCKNGVWMERGEYDGSEWYNTYKYPDFKEHFDEKIIIQYERSLKLERINK